MIISETEKTHAGNGALHHKGNILRYTSIPCIELRFGEQNMVLVCLGFIELNFAIRSTQPAASCGFAFELSHSRTPAPRTYLGFYADL